MAQKALSEETKERAKAMRQAGATIEQIKDELGISYGAAWGATKGVEKPAKRIESQKEGTKTRREGKDIMDRAADARVDEDTVRLANEVRRARLQLELDEIQNRQQQMQRMRELETRERELRLELDEARAKAASGGDTGAVNEEIRELRGKLDELRELRYQQDLAMLRTTFEGRIDDLQRQLGSQPRTGLTEYDILDRVITKGERAIYRIGDQAHTLFSEIRDDHLAREAIAMGIDLDTYQELLKERTPSEFDRSERMELLKLQFESQERQLTEEENKRMMELWEKQARAENAWRARRQQILNIISQRAGRQPLIGREGHVPAPGEPEPPVLKAESRLVTCSRCQTTFDIDLVAAKQQSTPGKRLYVTCANPHCGFLLDLTDLLGLQAAPKAPKGSAPSCYAGTPNGCASKGLYVACHDCQYRDFAVTYE